jgi:hypothetical protein
MVKYHEAQITFISDSADVMILVDRAKSIPKISIAQSFMAQFTG